MMEMPAGVADTMRSIGLTPVMRAAGVFTGMLSIPQPVLLVGAGSSRRLGEAIAGFGHRKVMLVTDRIVASLGLHHALVEALEAGGVGHVLYDGISPDAPIPEVERGIELYRKEGCDALVAVGGGSPMDAAKVIASAVANHKPPRKLVGYFKGLKTPEPIYAVPTTAGTGSEVTVAAVISDLEERKKYVVADTRLVPRMAALDPLLMTGLPQQVTAATGMDALTHATEAYVSKWASADTDRLALAAVAMIYRNLRKAYRHGDDLAAREQMSLAATYAGMAFTRANVGYVHAIAHQLGGRYHVPHGLANAIMLPHVLKFLSPAVTGRLADLAIRAGVGEPGEKPQALARKFIESVEKLNHDVGIPTTVAALRAEEIPQLAKDACWEADTNYPVPRYMSRDTCEGILRRVLPATEGHGHAHGPAHRHGHAHAPR
jgi:alcohol dehydrogenase class IV